MIPSCSRRARFSSRLTFPPWAGRYGTAMKIVKARHSRLSNPKSSSISRILPRNEARICGSSASPASNAWESFLCCRNLTMTGLKPSCCASISASLRTRRSGVSLKFRSVRVFGKLSSARFTLAPWESPSWRRGKGSGVRPRQDQAPARRPAPPGAGPGSGAGSRDPGRSGYSG